MDIPRGEMIEIVRDSYRNAGKKPTLESVCIGYTANEIARKRAEAERDDYLALMNI
jgi:hypothetical protein